MQWHRYYNHLKACGYQLVASPYPQMPYGIESLNRRGFMALIPFASHAAIARYLCMLALSDLRSEMAMQQDITHGLDSFTFESVQRCWIPARPSVFTSEDHAARAMHCMHMNLAKKRYPRLEFGSLERSAPFRRALIADTPGEVLSERWNAHRCQRDASLLLASITASAPNAAPVGRRSRL